MNSPNMDTGSTNKPADQEARIRIEIARVLKGPVAEKFKTLIPPLATVGDPFKAIMERPDLLDDCFKLFRANRTLFAEYLVDAEGRPVDGDQERLKCGRSIEEITGMVVRTGMRGYAEAHFGDPIDPKRPPRPIAAKANSAIGMLRLINIPRISELFRRNHGADKATLAGETKSGRFYNAIQDHLKWSWQVRFFPIYVEIPAHIIQRLGSGITSLDTEEKLHRLAQLAFSDLQRAEQVVKDPDLVREMLENNVLASAAVSELGEQGFEIVREALAGIDNKKKWDVFANRHTVKKLLDDKRITRGDIVALADYLDILNELALDAMLDLHLNRDQMRMFLKTAEDHLGRDLFLALFGPIQFLVPDDTEEQQKLRRYQSFTENALRGLVTAVKQLETSLSKPGEKVEIPQCLATVCHSRRQELERDIKRLAPACLGA